jgi:hypothetical protein
MVVLKTMSVNRHHRNDEQQNSKLLSLKHPDLLLALYAAGIGGAGGFAAGLICIELNKTLLNKLITTRIQAADLGNSILPMQTEGTKKDQD